MNGKGKRERGGKGRGGWKSETGGGGVNGKGKRERGGKGEG